jgi:hypothetical protein
MREWIYRFELAPAGVDRAGRKTATGLLTESGSVRSDRIKRLILGGGGDILAGLREVRRRSILCSLGYEIGSTNGAR